MALGFYYLNLRQIPLTQCRKMMYHRITMKMYHGTRRNDLQQILQQGLQPKEPMDVRDDVLASLGLAVGDVPEWTWKHEVAFREGQPKGIYLTRNPAQAAAYSSMGGEMAYNMRMSILRTIKGGGYRDHDEEAMLGNGARRFVVEVEVSDPTFEAEVSRVEKELAKISKKYSNPIKAPDMNLVVDEIRPEQIVAVEEVEGE